MTLAQFVHCREPGVKGGLQGLLRLDAHSHSNAGRFRDTTFWQDIRRRFHREGSGDDGARPWLNFSMCSVTFNSVRIDAE